MKIKNPLEKCCTKCKSDKPIDCFGVDNATTDGYTCSCRECRGKITKAWSLKNPERCRANGRRNKSTERAKQVCRKRRLERYHETKGTYMDFYRYIRGKTRYVISMQTGERGEVLKYIGCTRAEFMRHLESKFKPGMTWENYGEVWQVDHIYPFGKIDKRDKEALIRNLHWANTQPLFKEENRFKGASVSQLIGFRKEI